MTTSLLDLPSELLILVALELTPKDLGALARTSSALTHVLGQDYLWQLHLQERFQESAQEGCHLAVYKDLHSRSCKLFGSQLSIIWMDDQHWRLEGTSATLQIVWWFEVKATFRGVPKGVYTPVLNLYFSRALNLEDIKCRLKVEDGAEDDQQSMVEYSFSTLNGLESNNGPMRIKLPVLSIGQKQGSKKYYPVSFEMTDFDGTAKSGMRIDSVELEQCSENDIRMMDSRAILDNADPCVLLGNQLQITWMDNEHWRPQGSSVVLRSVWWFEVHGTFRNVRRGVYTPVLRVVFHAPEHLQDIRVRLNVVDDTHSSQHTDVEFTFSNVSFTDTGPIDITLPNLSVGTSPSALDAYDVVLEMVDLNSTTLKRGIQIDGIALRRVSSPGDGANEQSQSYCRIA